MLRCVFFVSLFVYVHASTDGSFSIDYTNNCFVKDGEPFRYVSGSIHYSRVPHVYWNDRLYKMRKAGLNAIQTYIPWNVHEPFEGQFDFTGQKNLVAFLKAAQSHDLLVILRAGPYICGEWEFGGLPYWLLKKAGIKLRTSETQYMLYVKRYFAKLLPLVKELLYENGGPVVTVQVENEYGSYGCDHEYMNSLEAVFQEHLGEQVVLFTTDGAGDGYLKCGALPSLYTTVDFGQCSDPMAYFKFQRKYQPNGPLVNSEFYTGWLDHWGDKHARVSTKAVVTTLDKMLALNASVNMYMFEGGTNFGFMNGANEGSKYQPQPTSYDYDAPLSESGDPRPKYFAIQSTIAKYLPIPSGPQPKPSPKAKYGKIFLQEAIPMISLAKKLPASLSATIPPSFEDVDLNYGYLIYKATIKCLINQLNVLTLTKFHDRVYVVESEKFRGMLDRNYNKSLTFECSSNTLYIIVENQGRVNYGPYMQSTKKGILSQVLCNGETIQLTAYSVVNNPVLQNAHENHAKPSKLLQPAFYFFHLDIDAEPKDTFLKLDSWKKGVVVINGVNIGCYWDIGPQQTLYVPGCYLSQGRNNVTLLETDGGFNEYVQFVDLPILG